MKRKNEFPNANCPSVELYAWSLQLNMTTYCIAYIIFHDFKILIYHLLSSTMMTVPYVQYIQYTLLSLHGIVLCRYLYLIKWIRLHLTTFIPRSFLPKHRHRNTS